MYEMKSLTLNGKKYDSFVDQEAREAIEEIERNGVGGNAPKITLEDVHDVSKGDGVKITVESGSIEDGSYSEQSETVWNGRNGTSAYASVITEDDGTVVITTKDASGNQTASVKSGKDGKDGQDGYTPVKGIDYFDGKDGSDGEDGVDGVSPTVSVSKSGKVTSITITDKNGTKTATINDGADGSNGSNGKDGTSVTVKSVSESTADGGSNVVTFSDGKTLSVKNGKAGTNGTNGTNGKDGKTPVRGADYWTNADQEAIVQQVIAALSTPVFGYVDEDKNIVVHGDLPDGTYTFMYEDANGEKVTIGTTEIGGVLYNNQIPISTDGSGNIYGEDYNGDGVNDGYKVNVRVTNGVDTSDQNSTGVYTTGYIPIEEGDVVYLKNVTMNKNASTVKYTCRVGMFSTLTSTDQKNLQAESATANWVWDDNGNAVQFTVPQGWFNSSGDRAKFMRIGASYIGPDSVVTINEPIV